MSVLVNKQTKVICQGITGSFGAVWGYREWTDWRVFRAVEVYAELKILSVNAKLEFGVDATMLPAASGIKTPDSVSTVAESRFSIASNSALFQTLMPY